MPWPSGEASSREWRADAYRGRPGRRTRAQRRSANVVGVEHDRAVDASRDRSVRVGGYSHGVDERTRVTRRSAPQERITRPLFSLATRDETNKSPVYILSKGHHDHVARGAFRTALQSTMKSERAHLEASSHLDLRKPVLPPTTHAVTAHSRPAFPKPLARNSTYLWSLKCTASVILGVLVAWHFFGETFAYVLGLPEQARLLSYAAFALLTPYAFLRSPKLDVGTSLLVLFTVVAVVRSLPYTGDDYLERQLLFIAGLLLPFITISKLVAIAERTIFCTAATSFLAIGALLTSALLIPTEAGRAVLVFNTDSNPVGLSVSFVAAVAAIAGFCVRVINRLPKPGVKDIFIGLALIGVAGVLASRSLLLGTRSLIFVYVGLGIALLPAIRRDVRIRVGALIAAGIVILIMLRHDEGAWSFAPGRAGERFTGLFELAELSRNDVSALWRFGDAAIVDRLQLWNEYLTCFAAQPLLGCGYRLAEVEEQAIYAHNILVGIAGEFGLVGLALFIALLVVIARRVPVVRLNQDPVALLGVLLTIGGMIQLLFSLDLPIAKHFTVGIALLNSTAAHVRRTDRTARIRRW